MKPENLIMHDGCHTIRIDLYEDWNKQKQCRITCIDDLTTTIDLDGEWIEEEEEGCFYASIEGIDLIIEKLNEAKAYLKQ